MKLPHSVCLDCRVAMKGIPICPHCKKKTIDMGRDFKAPRKLDKSSWKAVEAFVARGMKGDSSYNSKRAPKTANAVDRKFGTIDEVCARRIDPKVRKILAKRNPKATSRFAHRNPK